MTTPLQTAHEVLVAAAAAESAANSDLRNARTVHITAINALNAAQKEFDAVVATIHKAAALDSDWANQIRAASRKAAA